MHEKISWSKLYRLIFIIEGVIITLYFSVPYHCPEQYPLKEFLQRLKASKGTLISEEKVEIKTSKLKLLKDVPRLEIPVPDPGTSESFEAETADAQPGPSNATNVPEKCE